MPVATLEDGQFVEANGSETIAIMNVLLDSPAVSPTVLGYRIVSGLGTAIEGVDVRDPFPTSVLRFNPGDQTGQISLRVLGDLDIENDEAFVVEIYKISGDVTFPGGGPVDRAVGWILDNDGNATPNAAYVLGSLVEEGNAGTHQADFEINLSRAVDKATTISYATVAQSAAAGVDFVSKTGSVDLIQGERTATVSVGIRGDTVSEFDETFGLRLVNPPANVGSVALGHLTILDDDQPGPTLRISTSTVQEPNASEITHSFFLTLSRPSTVDVVVGYRLVSGTAQDNVDVRLPFGSSTVTIPAGQTVVELGALRALGDITAEADESYFIEGTIISGNALFEGGERVSRATGWILDNDGAPNPLAIAIADTRVTEGNGGARTITVSVELSRPAPADLVVDYATKNGTGSTGARAGHDFKGASGEILFREGQSEASFTLNILGNRYYEPNETFSIVLTPQTALNGRLSAAVTILDNDPPPSNLADRLGDPAAHEPLFIDGLGGNDVIFGGTAADGLIGNSGNDSIEGGRGADTLRGDSGEDTLNGDSGNDVLRGGADRDFLRGDAGNDRLFGEAGNDRMWGGGGNDEILGGKGNDVLSGDAGKDTIFGQQGNDRVTGAGGNDSLTGASGNDTLSGGRGADTLNGGSGDDRMSGGPGNDRYVFDDKFGRDVLVDFNANSGREKIDLSAASDANNFRQLIADAHQAGNKVVLEVENDTIVLLHTHLDDLDRSDFIL